MKHRPLLVGFGALFLAQAFVYLRGHTDGAGAQPIAYNHAKHLAAGLTCTDCHAGARTQEHATLPALETCMSCHESALTQSSEEAKLRALAAGGRELAWTQVTRVPAHVYFSHRRHVTLGRIECVSCHGAMEKVSAPPSRPFRDFSMTACIGCHEQNHARTDCNDCHR